MKLSDKAVLNAKAKEKQYRLSDGRGLYLIVFPNSTKAWRTDYTFDGRRNTLSLGVYPETGLKLARDKNMEVRRQVAEGIDPSRARKQSRSLLEQGTFDSVAATYFAKPIRGCSARTAEMNFDRVKKNVLPWLGAAQVNTIKPQDVILVLRRIEARGAYEVARRMLQSIGQVMRFAVQNGLAEYDPTRDLKGVLAGAQTTHFAAITEPYKVGHLLRAIDAFKGTYVVMCALKLAPLVFVRPGELRTMRWVDVDLKAAEWRYTVSKTKTEHLVPLAKQALSILQDIRPLTGKGEYVFPGARDLRRPMSEAAINAALQRIGYDTKTEITGHGFRAMARTLIHEELGIRPEVIEHQLAHRVPDALGSAYNRTKFIKDRVAMMQLWADYLDKLKAGAEVVSISGRAA